MFISKSYEYPALIIALLLVTAGAYNLTSHKEDPFSEEINARTEHVNILMHSLTADNSISIQKELKKQGAWSGRQAVDGDQLNKKETFETYLEACNVVVIATYHGETPNTSEMNRLYGELVR